MSAEARASQASPDSTERRAAVQRVLVLVLLLNLGVAAAKVVYGTLSGALSIRADGFHSVTDSANNVVGLVAVWLASRPPDAGHPYGHRKFELLAAGIVGLLLLAMAVDVVATAVGRLIAGGEPPRIEGAGFVVMLVTLGINVVVATFEARRGRALRSTFLLADAAHTRADVFVTVGVVASMVAVKAGRPQVDALAALGVAGFIAWAGFSVLRSNTRYLADVALISPDRIEAIVVRVPGVASTHKIRSRGVPGAIQVDLHIQIAPHLNVVQAHRVTHAVIDAIRIEVTDVVDVVVHTEPARPGEPYTPFPDGEGAP